MHAAFNESIFYQVLPTPGAESRPYQGILREPNINLKRCPRTLTFGLGDTFARFASWLLSIWILTIHQYLSIKYR